MIDRANGSRDDTECEVVGPQLCNTPSLRVLLKQRQNIDEENQSPGCDSMLIIQNQPNEHALV